MWKDRYVFIVLLFGLSLGLLGVVLAVLGNPENSGICVSCFLENTAGSIGLHSNTRMQYLRPELTGFVLGALASSLLFREFSSRSGSSPMIRLFGGFFLIAGCAVFIGCPIKLFLRLTAGDLTALAGLAGLAGGVWAGLGSLRHGFSFRPARAERGSGGLWIPAFFLLLLLWMFQRPAFVLAAERGSAAEHAPGWMSLAAGLLLGALAQRSRFCITGSLRDLLLMGGRSPLIYGLGAFIIAAASANLLTGRFHLGMYGQPGAHLDYVWSFLGMGLVGWISVLLEGCPFRQLVKAGEGDADAGLVVVGMLIGSGLVQSWGLSATAAGVPIYGKITVLAGFAFVLSSALFLRERSA